MARYQLIVAVEAQPSGWPRRKLIAGATIADTVGNALAGDFVLPSLTTGAPNINQMIPLDAAAVAAFAAVGVVTVVGGPRLRRGLGRVGGGDDRKR
jgi:hypothetical protein